MFKRRTPRTYLETFAHSVYPRGGWHRAARYIGHRLRRLPDPAHKIARGIAAGVFVCFTPFFGLHFVLSAGLAWAVRGNMLAALLATFFGNPVTFPIIATVSVELGSVILGRDPIPLQQVVTSFSYASFELWSNLGAMFSGGQVEWERFPNFFDRVFWPYFVGGLVPGAIAAAASYALSQPVIHAYQRARLRRLKKRFEDRETAGPG